MPQIFVSTGLLRSAELPQRTPRTQSKNPSCLDLCVLRVLCGCPAFKQSLERGPGIRLDHEPLTHQERAIAKLPQPEKIFGGTQAALGHSDDIPGYPCNQCFGSTHVDRQCPQIPVVDADDPCARIDRSRYLIGLVYFDEHVQPERRRLFSEVTQLLLVKGRHNQEDRIRSCGFRLEQLIFGDDEVLPQQWHVDLVSNRLKVLERSVEKRRLGQD